MASFKQHAAFGSGRFARGRTAPRHQCRRVVWTADEGVDLPPRKALAAYVKKAMALNDAGSPCRGSRRAREADQGTAGSCGRPQEQQKAQAAFDTFSPVTSASTSSGSPKRKATRRGRALAQAIEWIAQGEVAH